MKNSKVVNSPICTEIERPFERVDPPPLMTLTAHFVNDVFIISNTRPRIRLGDPTPSITGFKYLPRDAILLQRM
jgi:hypothetical protein